MTRQEYIAQWKRDMEAQGKTVEIWTAKEFYKGTPIEPKEPDITWYDGYSPINSGLPREAQTPILVKRNVGDSL